MAKEVCSSFNELLETVAALNNQPNRPGEEDNYDLGHTNNISLAPQDGIFPKVRGGEESLKKWRCVGKGRNASQKIDFIIDHLGVTVMLPYNGDLRTEYFQCKNEHPVEVLKRIFEWVLLKSYGWAENFSLSFFYFCK